MADIPENKKWILLRLLIGIPLSPIIALGLGYAFIWMAVKDDLTNLFRKYSEEELELMKIHGR